MLHFKDSFVEEIIVFDTAYVAQKHLIESTPSTIIRITELEEGGVKDRQIARKYGTFEYIIFCLN